MIVLQQTTANLQVVYELVPVIAEVISASTNSNVAGALRPPSLWASMQREGEVFLSVDLTSGTSRMIHPLR
jgi:hypothetical protein